MAGTQSCSVLLPQSNTLSQPEDSLFHRLRQARPRFNQRRQLGVEMFPKCFPVWV